MKNKQTNNALKIIRKKFYTDKPERLAELDETRTEDYPEETKGSELANKIRAACNKLSIQQREDLFIEGLAKIYHGKIKGKSLLGFNDVSGK